MSKRVRGTRRPSSARPGGRPVRRSAPPLAVPAPGAVAEVSGPAPAPVEAPGASQVVRATVSRGGPARPSALAARAAAEYVYVGQDLRHIAIMAGAIVIVLAVLFVLIDIVRVIQL